MIVATPHASHTICHKTLSMAASFWARVHFDHTGGLPGRPEANVPHQVSVDPPFNIRRRPCVFIAGGQPGDRLGTLMP
jgi:hypothetical protein